MVGLIFAYPERTRKRVTGYAQCALKGREAAQNASRSVS